MGIFLSLFNSNAPMEPCYNWRFNLLTHMPDVFKTYICLSRPRYSLMRSDYFSFKLFVSAFLPFISMNKNDRTLLKKTTSTLLPFIWQVMYILWIHILYWSAFLTRPTIPLLSLTESASLHIPPYMLCCVNFHKNICRWEFHLPGPHSGHSQE